MVFPSGGWKKMLCKEKIIDYHKKTMPNEFSVEIHNYLTQKITEARKAVAEKNEKSSFYQGQLDELYRIREYLKENIDLKNFTYY